MFKVNSNEVLELQIKAAEKEALEFVTDSDKSPLSRANTLRQALQMKEKAARFVFEKLDLTIKEFTLNGVSSVSLLAISEAFLQAIESSTAQMQVFANELAKLTRNAEMEEAYSVIAERLISEAEDLITPLREQKEKAVSNIDSMAFVEIYETWHNLENKPI